jgi:hypothetical protein
LCLVVGPRLLEAIKDATRTCVPSCPKTRNLVWAPLEIGSNATHTVINRPVPCEKWPALGGEVP